MCECLPLGFLDLHLHLIYLLPHVVKCLLQSLILRHRDAIIELSLQRDLSFFKHLKLTKGPLHRSLQL